MGLVWTPCIHRSGNNYLKSLMFIKGSDNAVLSVLTLDPKENERPAKKIKAEKAKDVEEVTIDV